MSDIAIRVENLGKQYRIGARQEKYQTLRDAMVETVAAPFKRARQLMRGEAYGAANLSQIIWALKDVSFEVKHGDTLGIVGHNGAGKSTLLKILSRITKPSEGYARVYGRVGSLLEVGTGFHLELTGRENIYLNGTILGMHRPEIDRKFDEIVAFSGVEQFIDTPVKFYSSGMRLRLGFAVAAHLEPEILVIDEVLAVGDAEFQKKSLNKMSDVAHAGRTVLFVSHNLAAVQTLCNKGILLKGGQVVYRGTASEVVDEYLATKQQASSMTFDANTKRRGNGQARILGARLLNRDGQEINSILMGGSVTVEIEFETYAPLRNPNFGVRLGSAMNQHLALWRTLETHGEMPDSQRGGVVRLTIDALNLMPGMYALTLGISDAFQDYDVVDEALELEIDAAPIYATGKLPPAGRAILYTPCSWEVDYQ